MLILRTLQWGSQHGHGLVLALVGVAFGLGAAAGLTRLMSSLLFGVRPPMIALRAE